MIGSNAQKARCGCKLISLPKSGCFLVRCGGFLIPPLIFITGTDTDVGKTLVTSLLGLRLQRRGVRVGAMKPFASGCHLNEHRVLESADATFLCDTLRLQDEMSLINPCRWTEALTPLAASRRENTPFRNVWNEAKPALEKLQSRYDCVLVEGVGGLSAPIFHQENGAIWTNQDLINELGCPVVVVARRTLGTINHTSLTCRAPLQNGSHFAGIVWCDSIPIEENDIAAATSPALVEEITGLKSWGTVPFLENLERRTLESAAQNFLSWPV